MQSVPNFSPSVAEAPVARQRPANDRYGEVIVGGLRTACIGRKEMTELMVEDCFAARTQNLAPKLIFAANGHAIATAALDESFRNNFEQADLIHADGQPIIAISKLLTDTPVPERTATTDFIHDAAAAAAEKGLTFYLLGGTEEANAKSAEILAEKYPGLKIVGRRHGYFSIDEEDDICDEIAAVRPDVLWVGLGVPKEYDFCVRNKHLLQAGWVVTCGGCFNFVTGGYSRAPELLQQTGFEWAYRLFKEPKRLFWRYLTTNPVALFLLFTQTRSVPRQVTHTGKIDESFPGLALPSVRAQ